MKDILDLRQNLEVIARLGSAAGLLGWDQEVNLPPKGQKIRGEVSALLAAEIHKRATDPIFVKLAKSLATPASLYNLSKDNKVIAREVWRDVDRAQRLPVEFVEEFARLTSDAFAAWHEARKKSDFKIFSPYLKKVVKMNQREAEYLGYKGSPYNALLDGFEPGMTTDELDRFFGPLAKSLSELISQAGDIQAFKLPKFKYPPHKQDALNQIVAQDIGYDLEAGRIDPSPHPFTINLQPTDVRITTRYSEDDFFVSLGSVVHEVGHALYEQGLPAKEFGTPLGEAVSLGIHESQSRIWENFVGRGQPFVSYLYPLMTKHFGKLPYNQKDLYKWLNRIQPSLIRVESDETTYNLHIVLRYEIEKGLVEGSLKVEDLPNVWKQKMKDYLGVKVPNDAKGVLQDIHWSHGTLGYFPTYTLGNLYAAQLFHKITGDIPDLNSKFAAGDFKEFLAWLRRNIHRHGRRYSPDQLIKKATGEPLNPNYLVEHLRVKLVIK